MATDFAKMKDKAINRVGLYTEEQIGELEQRIDDLWMMLNELRSVTATYAYSIMVNVENKNHVEYCCEKMSDCADRVRNVLLD